MVKPTNASDREQARALTLGWTHEEVTLLKADELERRCELLSNLMQPRTLGTGTFPGTALLRKMRSELLARQLRKQALDAAYPTRAGRLPDGPYSQQVQRVNAGYQYRVNAEHR